MWQMLARHNKLMLLVGSSRWLLEPSWFGVELNRLESGRRVGGGPFLRDWAVSLAGIEAQHLKAFQNQKVRNKNTQKL